MKVPVHYLHISMILYHSNKTRAHRINYKNCVTDLPKQTHSFKSYCKVSHTQLFTL